MILSAAVVLVLFIAGDTLVDNFSLPIPGATLGLVLLTGFFAYRGGPDSGSEDLFDFAVPYFPLFFVPAAVGVIGSIDILVSAWPHVLFAIVFGTAIALVCTGLAFEALLRRMGRNLNE
jgi:holin-like protein